MPMWYPSMSRMRFTVSALLDSLQGLLLPRTFIEYIVTVYRSIKIVLEVSRKQSNRVTRGVRQEVALPTLLFSMVVDRILKKLPSKVGYTIRQIKINGLAYVEDILLYASTT